LIVWQQQHQQHPFVDCFCWFYLVVEFPMWRALFIGFWWARTGGKIWGPLRKMLGSIYLSTCCGVQGHSIVDFSFVAAFRATLRTNTKATSKIKKKNLQLQTLVRSFYKYFTLQGQFLVGFLRSFLWAKNDYRFRRSTLNLIS